MDEVEDKDEEVFNDDVEFRVGINVSGMHIITYDCIEDF